eukprot:CAMPEP_0119207542 /NCGR_PEP_ID=MMETSP1327-20130426/24_1 /TAXON_ID=38833 /ORGANISM="Micromonas pusilla, Strain RCC2306" /LENGTH=113 /DNA_ID=CAMNT_0007203947 /DNA_START=29 /DNA_END=366 /DNA_ORIENTATION=-
MSSAPPLPLPSRGTTRSSSFLLITRITPLPSPKFITTTSPLTIFFITSKEPFLTIMAHMPNSCASPNEASHWVSPLYVTVLVLDGTVLSRIALSNFFESIPSQLRFTLHLPRA